ncbi:MAG: ATP-binding protein [Deltaproteobacteria bacterium]|nr:ATP-binding protein [Deltaproteobacteria bacterium]
MYSRIVNILLSHSFFLFGARGTGKSTHLGMILDRLHPLVFDLLDTSMELELSKNPELMLQRSIESNTKWIFIDEVQKVPQLLDWVHKGIEQHGLKFALTGSSARKLKRGGANLLAGRAFIYNLFPLLHSELKDSFDLMHILRFGALPKVFSFHTDHEKVLFLRAYANTYLKEEIQSEQLVRNLPSFQRFLEVAAQSNGQILNYSKIGRDALLEPKTVERYFEILEDTLLGHRISGFHGSVRKQLSLSPKFYFFDLGVKRALEKSVADPLRQGSYEYGRAFEHFIICECLRLNAYLEKDYRFYYLKTKDNAEIDLVIDRGRKGHCLIEIKSADKVSSDSTRTLEKFIGDFRRAQAFVICQEKSPKKIGNVSVLPWKQGLKKIFD